jgi:hypothetical protein
LESLPKEAKEFVEAILGLEMKKEAKVIECVPREVHNLE